MCDSVNFRHDINQFCRVKPVKLGIWKYVPARRNILPCVKVVIVTLQSGRKIGRISPEGGESNAIPIDEYFRRTFSTFDINDRRTNADSVSFRLNDYRIF